MEWGSGGESDELDDDEEVGGEERGNECGCELDPG